MGEVAIHNEGEKENVCRLHLSETAFPHSRLCLETYIDEFKNINRYPDPSCAKLVEAISKKYGILENQIFVGNGLDEVIFLLCVRLVRGGKRALINPGTYPGHELSTQAVGGKVTHVPLTNFRVNPELYRLSLKSDVSAAFICNPHNPCGTALTKEEVISFAHMMTASGVIPIVDEAYVDFAGEEEHSLINNIDDFEQLVILRSFSKSFGLAGLRVGFAVGKPELIKELHLTARSLPFRVNRVAQRVAIELLSDESYLKGNAWLAQRLIRQAQHILDQVGITYVPSSTNFLFISEEGLDGGLKDSLNRAGIQVRDCKSFGHPGWLRVSFGNEGDLNIFQAALAETQAVRLA